MINLHYEFVSIEQLKKKIQQVDSNAYMLFFQFDDDLSIYLSNYSKFMT